MMLPRIRGLAKKALPYRLTAWIQGRRRRWRGAPIWARSVWSESFRRVRPFRPGYGIGYGEPIDRYYIEAFLDQWAEDIQGHVMELEDNAYTMRFGGARVLRWEILEAPPGNERATIVADLTKADAIPSESFDCIILTQALQYIYDLPAAIMTMERILRPGGVVLATLPGISQVSPFGMDRWGEYWRFTTASAQALFSERFPESSVTVEGHGNVLASIAFLHGLVTSELTKEELDHPDPKYQLLITVRAVKTHVM